MAINVWTGRGIWEGWTMRKVYENCKFGESVLVDPDGVPYSPAEIMASRNMALEKNQAVNDEKIRRQK